MSQHSLDDARLPPEDAPSVPRSRLQAYKVQPLPNSASDQYGSRPSQPSNSATAWSQGAAPPSPGGETGRSSRGSGGIQGHEGGGMGNGDGVVRGSAEGMGGQHRDAPQATWLSRPAVSEIAVEEDDEDARGPESARPLVTHTGVSRGNSFSGMPSPRASKDAGHPINAQAPASQRFGHLAPLMNAGHAASTSIISSRSAEAPPISGEHSPAHGSSGSGKKLLSTPLTDSMGAGSAGGVSFGGSGGGGGSSGGGSNDAAFDPYSGGQRLGSSLAGLPGSMVQSKSFGNVSAAAGSAYSGKLDMRRASFVKSSAYVPLGIRKLQTLYAGPEKTPSSRDTSNAEVNLGRALFMVPPNFGSHMQLFPQDSNAEKRSLTARKKRIYVQISLVFGVILLAFAIYDYVALLAFKRVSAVRDWLLSIQILQVASFYLCFLGFVYANEAGDLKSLYLVTAGFFVNLVSFLARTCFDIIYEPYMPREVSAF